MSARWPTAVVMVNVFLLSESTQFVLEFSCLQPCDINLYPRGNLLPDSLFYRNLISITVFQMCESPSLEHLHLSAYLKHVAAHCGLVLARARVLLQLRVQGSLNRDGPFHHSIKSLEVFHFGCCRYFGICHCFLD